MLRAFLYLNCLGKHNMHSTQASLIALSWKAPVESVSFKQLDWLWCNKNTKQKILSGNKRVVLPRFGYSSAWCLIYCFCLTGMLRPLKLGTSQSLTFSTLLFMMVRIIVWRTRCSLSPSPLLRGSHLSSPSAAALRWAPSPLHHSGGFMHWLQNTLFTFLRAGPRRRQSPNLSQSHYCIGPRHAQKGPAGVADHST